MTMATCEDYPCCGHTDGLGCDYQPDMDFINTHAACDHEIGDCQLVNTADEENCCEQCGMFMNYYNGIEGKDYIWGYVPLAEWVNGVGWDHSSPKEYRFRVAHIDCFPEGTSLEAHTMRLIEEHA